MTMTLEIAPPLPDELVYSALARAKCRMGWSTTRFSHQAFSGRTIIVRPHLCGQLDLVATTMKAIAGWSYSAEQLRDRYTIFPLISPLLEDSYWQKCTAALQGDRVSRHYVGFCRQLLGVTPFTLLKSCPECRRRDRAKYGESYFHGVHQVPGIRVCAHDGCVLQECPVPAEPDMYIALDEVAEHRRLRVPSPQVELQLRMASGILDLVRNPEQPGSATEFLPLLRRLTGRHTAPVLEMLSLTASARTCLSFIAKPSGAQPQTMIRSTDEKWLRLTRRFLPGRVHELRDTYRRRIAWLTLRREVECHAQARLPARSHIPRAAAYIDTFVETTAEADERLARLSRSIEKFQNGLSAA